MIERFRSAILLKRTEKRSKPSTATPVQPAKDATKKLSRPDSQQQDESSPKIPAVPDGRAHLKVSLPPIPLPPSPNETITSAAQLITDALLASFDPPSKTRGSEYSATPASEPAPQATLTRNSPIVDDLLKAKRADCCEIKLVDGRHLEGVVCFSKFTLEGFVINPDDEYRVDFSAALVVSVQY